MHGTNQWPEQRPSFEKQLRSYFEHCQQLGQAIMRGDARERNVLSHPLLSVSFVCAGMSGPRGCQGMPSVMKATSSDGKREQVRSVPDQASRWASGWPRTTLRRQRVVPPQRTPHTGWPDASTTHHWPR